MDPAEKAAFQYGVEGGDGMNLQKSGDRAFQEEGTANAKA